MKKKTTDEQLSFLIVDLFEKIREAVKWKIEEVIHNNTSEFSQDDRLLISSMVFQELPSMKHSISDDYQRQAEAVKRKIDRVRYETSRRGKSFDKFDNELKDGDTVKVQNVATCKIYKKEDGCLYFKPYEKEEMVNSYFSNDIIKSI